MRYLPPDHLKQKVKSKIDNYNLIVSDSAKFYQDVNLYNKNSYDNLELCTKSMKSSYALLCGIIEGVNACLEDAEFELVKEKEVLLQDGNTQVHTGIYTYSMKVNHII